MRIPFDLKTLFFLVALAALASAVLLPAIVERIRVNRLSGAGVQIYTEPRGQFLLRQVVGDRLSERVVFVHLDDPDINDAWLENLVQFPYIENVSIKSERVTDSGLRHLERLPNLMSLDLIDTQITPAGIAKFRSSARGIRRVQAYSNPH